MTIRIELHQSSLEFRLSEKPAFEVRTDYVKRGFRVMESGPGRYVLWSPKNFDTVVIERES